MGRRFMPLHSEVRGLIQALSGVVGLIAFIGASISLARHEYTEMCIFLLWTVMTLVVFLWLQTEPTDTGADTKDKKKKEGPYR